MDRKSELREYYKERFQRYGVDERALGWSRNKQDVRFYALTKYFDLDSASVLDIGCGFGDFVNYADRAGIKYSKYLGIDLNDDFIKVARKKHNSTKVKFINDDFLDMQIESVDFAFASGIFGHLIFENEEQQYSYIDEVFSKTLSIVQEGMAFDFLSSNVDYRTSARDFHADPARILNIAYHHSRNILLNNSIMPFEYSIVLFKDDSYNDKTIFNHFFR